MIKQAIIPLAGLGTRLLPLTSVLPKELLPINGKPGLEYILEEGINAGIKEFIFIISSKKKEIKKYFYNDSFYKKIIKKNNKNKRLKMEFAKIIKYKKIIKFVYQDVPRGTGDAVLKCKNYIRSKYFLMLLPDDLIIKNNCSQSMIKLHKKYNSSVIASKKVKKSEVSRWGIFDLKKLNKNSFLIKDVIEKPSIKNAPSNYAIIGRYILPKQIFKILQKQKPGQNGEIHITDAIKTLINKKEKFLGHIFSGKYLDCGTMSGYINSSIKISKL
ncbi:MAG: sugar phosphate nucleotidyltransferase [Candidatus Pelagibacter bacterium]|nr:sugar phosphate nucleotidyltransferase [Candidatus Pelagibacter bacterium]